jgi:hypothetical protein
MPKATKATPTKTTTALALSPEAALAEIPALFDAIPDVSDDPTPRMAAAILNADDPDDWESVFSGRSIKDSAGKKVRVVALRKLPSSYEGIVKQYLVAEIIDLETGEHDVMTVSSVISMLQLLKAHKEGWLPLDVEVKRKEKPTARGFYPIHLKVLSRLDSTAKAS